MSAVETQSDIGVCSAVLEHMTGEPHDPRRVFDAQPFAVPAKAHFPSWSRPPDGMRCVAHSRYSLPTPLRIVLCQHRPADPTPVIRRTGHLGSVRGGPTVVEVAF